MSMLPSPSTMPALRSDSLGKRNGCGSRQSGTPRHRRWPLIAAVALAAIGLVIGSILFGFAAVLPLLYTLPCLLMLAMCMFGQGQPVHPATPAPNSLPNRLAAGCATQLDQGARGMYLTTAAETD